jgi:hypothetical protein
MWTGVAHKQRPEEAGRWQQTSRRWRSRERIEQEERKRGEREEQEVARRFQVRASYANRSDVTESRCLLWQDSWTRGARRLGRQSRHSRLGTYQPHEPHQCI